MSMTERQKMVAGLPYDPGDPELQTEQAAAKHWMARYNAALAATPADRRELLRQRLGEVAEGAVIRPPVPCEDGVACLARSSDNRGMGAAASAALPERGFPIIWHGRGQGTSRRSP